MSVLADTELTRIQADLSLYFANGIACLDLFVEAKDVLNLVESLRETKRRIRQLYYLLDAPDELGVREYNRILDEIKEALGD